MSDGCRAEHGSRCVHALRATFFFAAVFATGLRLGLSIVPTHFGAPQRQAQICFSFDVRRSSSTMP